MFNKLINVHDNRSAVVAARITAQATEDLGNKLESISQAEVKSKDRVDISLEEYQRMRDRILKLEGKYSRISDLITKLGIPTDVIDTIFPDSIKVYTNDEYANFTRKYRIEFDADVLKGKLI